MFVMTLILLILSNRNRQVLLVIINVLIMLKYKDSYLRSDCIATLHPLFCLDFGKSFHAQTPKKSDFKDEALAVHTLRHL